MKHNLTLTDLIVNVDAIENDARNKVNIEIVATINGNVIKHITRPLVLSSGKHTLAVVRAEFEQALSGICLQAALYLQNRNIEVFYPAGMTVDEKLSTFNLKQTTTFSNDVHSYDLGTSSITTAIW